MMFNGPLIRKAINHQPGTFLDSVISNDSLRFPRQVDQLFLAALSRKADTREQKMADQLLASYYGDTSLALQDLWWALLNSNEFLLIH